MVEVRAAMDNSKKKNERKEIATRHLLENHGQGDEHQAGACFGLNAKAKTAGKMATLPELQSTNQLL